MNKNKIGSYIIYFLRIVAFVFCVFICKKMKVISIPDSDDMISFQFNLITISTVFAGFSFTVLGMLLGMFSEPLMQKLGDTTIITSKSEKLKRSIFCFCTSGAISLFYILGVDSFIVNIIPKIQNCLQYVFIICIAFLVIGIAYFLISTIGVFNIISKIYGNNIEKYDKQKRIYAEAKEKARNRS